MKEEKLKNVRRRNKYRSYRGECGKTAPNIVNRDFSTTGPNQKWTTDVTQINIGADKCYLSPILDMYNGEIVSYTISDRPDLKMVMDMLDNALMENFFGIMKSELLYPNTFKDLDHFKRELEEYIDYYNNDRIKLRLKGMSPVQYRTHNSILS